MDNFTKCIITTYKHQLVEFKGDHYYSILKDNILFNNTIIPNVEENNYKKTIFSLFKN